MIRHGCLLLFALGSIQAAQANPENGLELYLDFEETDSPREVKDGSGKNRHGNTNETPDSNGAPVTQTSPVAANSRFRFLTQKPLLEQPMEVKLMTRNQGEILLSAGTDYETVGGSIKLLRSDIPAGSQLSYTYQYFNEPLLRDLGVKGSALGFDGANDWVDVTLTEPLDLAAGLTISAWIKPDKRRAPIEILFAVGGTWGLSFYENTLIFRFGGAFASDDPKRDRVNFANFKRPPVEWTHLVVVADGSDVRLYVNGVETEAVPGVLNGASPPANSPSTLRIGGGGSYNYRGLIDEFRIYNRVLSPEEIVSLAKPN